MIALLGFILIIFLGGWAFGSTHEQKRWLNASLSDKDGFRQTICADNNQLYAVKRVDRKEWKDIP